MVVQMTAKVIGISAEEAAKFWQNQGAHPTCMLVAISSMLLSIGIDVDYQALLGQATSEIRFDTGETLYSRRFIDSGTHLIEPSKPQYSSEFYDILSQLPAEYFEYVRGEHSGSDLLNYIINNQGTLPSPATAYLVELLDYRDSDDYDGYTQTYGGEPVINFQAGNVSRSWDAARMLFEHNNITPRTGVGSDFSTVIQELEAGNPLLVFLDAREIRDNAVPAEIQDQQDRINYLNSPGNLQSALNHAVYITGIEIHDGVPYFVVVDSASGRGTLGSDTDEVGTALLYRVDRFAAGWEDGEYMYMTVGDTLQ